jgi:predicted MFS family arabinose efflux permease
LLYIVFFIGLSFVSQSNFYGAGLLLLVGSLLALLLFNVEKKQKIPLINFNYFKNDIFLKANLIQLFFQMSHFGSFFIIGLFLQIGLGFSPEKTGLIIAMQALGAMFVIMPSKRFFYRLGPVRPMSLGLIGIAIVTPFILLISSIDQMIFACLILFCRGLFSGWVGTPLYTMSVLHPSIEKKEVGRLTGLFNITRQLSISLGICMSAIFIGIMNHFYQFDYIHAVLGHTNAVKLFWLGIMALSIFSWIAAMIAFRVDNGAILKQVSSKSVAAKPA